MTCNGWKVRLLYGFTLLAANFVHPIIVRGVSNTPEGMFIYHLTAAAFDFVLLLCASSILSGRLSIDMQYLCLLSMIVNFAGWVLYMAYAPPITYSYAIGVLSYVQYFRLITMGLYGIDRVGKPFLRGPDHVGQELYYQKA